MLQRLSRTQLALMSGVSESQIGNLETRATEPKRTTVIDLATALPGWKVDHALALAGHTPLSLDERVIEASRAAASSRSELDRLWPQASPAQQEALLRTLATMVNPGIPLLSAVTEADHYREGIVEAPQDPIVEDSDDKESGGELNRP